MNNPIHRQRITKSGWLRKQGGMVRTWHRRWFCLNGDCLFYFTKEDDLRPQGSIFLPGNRIAEIQWTPDDSDKYLFEICPGKTQSRTAPSEVFQLCAGNNDERQQWMKAIRKVIYSDIGGAIFGQSIEETMMYEQRMRRSIPYLIEQSVEFLTQYGLEVEGIFRLPGRTTLIKELKDRFDCAERIVFDISEHDVHSVASLLKMYFRELPESIIPSSYYQRLMNVAMNFQDAKETEKKTEAVANAANALSSLPDDNYLIVKYLCKFLCEVGEKSHINKMTTLNLATVFGPNIIRNVIEADSPELMMATADLTQQLCFMLINNCEDIFIDKKEEEKLEETKPEVPVENLLDFSDKPESADEIKPLPRISLRNNKAGSRGSSLLTSVTEELEKRKDNNILQPLFPSCRNSDKQNTSGIDLLDFTEPVKIESDNNNIISPPDPPKQKPVPPARRKKKSQNGGDDISPSCTLSRTSSTESEAIQDLKNQIEQLKTELESTRKECEAKIQDLKTNYNGKINVLRTNSANSERIYKERIQAINQSHSAQMEDLKKELEKGRIDRDGAVSKVMKLQTELNRYHLQYGQLHSPT
ncbi:rho GTPase-activating protein 24-like isoform X2 [Mytilus californianus]|uniref:rho GTPase-activating protein 24-like isoform X2 n=1 Tax=Mytilus californianus TaxID=6549 RepID=UPI00224841DC|nr:rho GTPase-activating protein 24-like isoform X2 [Mytilus californianus]